MFQSENAALSMHAISTYPSLRFRFAAKWLSAAVALASSLAWGQGLGGLVLGGGDLTPVFDPAVSAYATSVLALRTGIALHARVPSVASTLSLRDAEGRFRSLSPGATLAAGVNHMVALRDDGSVVAWGSNTQGQTVVPAAALSGVAAVAAGQQFSMALKTDGSVLLWGGNTTTSLAVPVAAQSGVIAIAGGGNHALALKEDGSVVAWGSNAYGQSTVPEQASAGVVAIAAGSSHSVALKADGSVLTWGLNFGAVPVAAQSGVVSVAAGADYVMAVRGDGQPVVWGVAPAGAISSPGLGIPADVGPVVGVAAGFRFPATLRADGTVQVWTNANNPELLAVPADARDATALAAASYFAAALKPDGTLRVWGLSGNTTVPAAAAAGLRLPNGARIALPAGETPLALRIAAPGDLALTRVPMSAVPGNRTFVLDAAGNPGTYSAPSYFPPAASGLVAVASETALKADGSVVVWRDTGGPAEVPAEVAQEPTVAIASMGNSARFALGRSGVLRAWGTMGFGVLTIPAAAQSDVVGVDVAEYYGLALRRDGRFHVIGLTARGGAVVWGGASGATMSVAGWAGSGVLAVAAGENFNLVLKRDGTLGAWGDNSSVTGAVPGGSDFVAIAAGYRHAIALRRDGSVAAWGENPSDQTVVPTLAQSGVVAISAAANHSLALRSDGRVVAWGNQATSPGYVGFTPGARRAYVLDATRAPASPALAEFGASAGALTPAFAPGTTAYSVAAPYAAASAALSARAAEPGQLQLRVNGLPFQRATSGPSLAAGAGFIVGIGPGGGAVFPFSASSVYTTVPVAAQSELVAIAAGGNHILALRADGTTVCWGVEQFQHRRSSGGGVRRGGGGGLRLQLARAASRRHGGRLGAKQCACDRPDYVGHRQPGCRPRLLPRARS